MPNAPPAALVSEDETTFDASVVPASVPAGAMTALPEAAVMSPLPFTVNDGMDVDEPKLPVFEFTVASVATTEPDPLAVTSPVSAVIPVVSTGVAQVPSPRQKVVPLADVPEFKLLIGRLPVTPPLEDDARLAAGTSADTMARNVGVDALPVVGPAQTVFADWVASVPVSVPEEVTGEPETVMIEDGSASPTLVTVPVPALPLLAAVILPPASTVTEASV